jgi:hypothetical protein
MGDSFCPCADFRPCAIHDTTEGVNMGRVKGSKNKPKENALTTAEPKTVTVVQPVETEVIGPDESGKPFRGIKQRKIAEQVAFLF